MVLRKGYRLGWAVGAVSILALTGCMNFEDTEKADQAQLQREARWPDRDISNAYCPRVEMGYVAAVAQPPFLEGKVCGHAAPFAVLGFNGSYPVRLSTEAQLNCVILSQLQRFVTDRVQPLALEYLHQPVTELSVAASYSCRTRNHKHGAKLSEHGKMNAIDISGVTLADGSHMTIKEDWGRRSRAGAFLRAFNREACKYFTTVIGPAGDKYHQDHLHLDHARHGKKGTWRVCQ